MKKVVKQSEPKMEVELKNVDLRMYYGAQINKGSNGNGMVCREKYKHGNFYLLSPDEFTNGNSWSSSYGSKFYSDTLEGLIDNLISKNIPVYEFGSFLELAQWVCKT